MKDLLHFEPLTPAKHNIYIEVGTQAYNEHYLHLWPNGDSRPYIENSFTSEVLANEEKDENTLLWLINFNGISVGIIKITIDCDLPPYSKTEALYVDKIYILRAHAGKGIGKKVLQFLQLRAEQLDKKVIWLVSMQKGPALSFYQKNGFQINCEKRVTLPNIIAEESLMWAMVKKLEVRS